MLLLFLFRSCRRDFTFPRPQNKEVKCKRDVCDVTERDVCFHLFERSELCCPKCQGLLLLLLLLLLVVLLLLLLAEPDNSRLR